MFTGIIEEVGTVLSAEHGRLAVHAPLVLDGTKAGDSILVSGACLTVAEHSADIFTADLAPETLRQTNLGRLNTGAAVNLERALAVGGRLGGHLVQGHVEGVGELLEYRPDGADGVMAYYRAPEPLLPYIVRKGFIAVDGASLTVVDVHHDVFSVTLIPFTRSHTNLYQRNPGDLVNLETDVIARYVERLVATERGGMKGDDTS